MWASRRRLRTDSCAAASMLPRMKGDRVEAVVDTGQGTQTFEIVATREHPLGMPAERFLRD